MAKQLQVVINEIFQFYFTYCNDILKNRVNAEYSSMGKVMYVIDVIFRKIRVSSVNGIGVAALIVQV